ncbi:hypothetical protein Tco_1472364 [Tanacetum coccineum]
MVQPAASAITRVPVNVGGSSSHTALINPFVPSPEPSPERKAEETPSRLEGEQVDMTTILLTQYPKTSITPEGKVIVISAPVLEVVRLSLTLRVNKGKGISKESDPPPLKLLKASKEIRPDPDAEVLIDYEINEKIYQITLEELKAFLRKGAN